MSYKPEHCCKEHKTGKKVKIEGITVCVNYSDFLSHTIENNLKHLDRLIVVTDMQDVLTVRLCEKHGVECIQTDAFYEDGAVFNKAKGINKALDCLDRDGWILHFDADVWFSPHIREVLDNRHLDEEAIYGIDRLMCHGYEDWIKFMDDQKAINELYYLVQARPFPIGARVAHYNQPDGWFPIGFFQLWHPCTSGKHQYPIDGIAADHTDVLHAKSFPMGKRHLIPETYVIHIDSEKAGNREMGFNWNGRKSVWFGEKPLDKPKNFLQKFLFKD